MFHFILLFYKVVNNKATAANIATKVKVVLTVEAALFPAPGAVVLVPLPPVVAEPDELTTSDCGCSFPIVQD